MLEENQKEYLKDKVRRDYMMGNINGIVKFPTNDEVDKIVDNMIKDSSNGIIGTTRLFQKNEVSNSNDYTKSFTEAHDNIEVLRESVTGEMNSVIDQINNSTVEKNASIRDLKNIASSFEEIESSRIKDNELSYSIIDNLNDMEKIDLNRTTADINLNAGIAHLSKIKSDSLQFPHYVNQSNSVFNILEGRSFIEKEAQVPGSTFGAMFSSDDSDRWLYEIKTNDAIRLTGYFTLKLSPVGDEIDINEVIIKLASSYNSDPNDPNGVIKIQSLSTVEGTNKWIDIPGGALEVSSSELKFNFSIKPTTHIRILFIKDWPDDYSSLTYNFGVTELIIRKTETVFESVLTTKSIEVPSFRRDTPSVYSVMLDSKHTISPGSNIKYYVGLDNPISGKIVDSNGVVVGIDSDDAYEIIPNSGNQNNYVYASQLRDKPWISGAYVYRNWEPKWLPISPLSDKSSKMPVVRYFNHNAIKNSTHDISYVVDHTWGDPAYTGPWPTEGSDWTDDWDHVGNAPTSGYIFGEDPWSDAGIWWDVGTEYPGWWRPHVPTASGTPDLNWSEAERYSKADYITSTHNGAEASSNQIYYWKIFKWPNGFQPIPGSVKLFVSTDQIQESIESDNKHEWKWNFKYLTNITEDTVVSNNNTGFEVLDLKLKYPDQTTYLVKDSIKDLEFLNLHPGDTNDWFVIDDIEYSIDENGFIVESKSQSDSQVATVNFLTDFNRFRSKTTHADAKIKYSYLKSTVEKMDASWENYFFVPSDMDEGKAEIRIGNHSGIAKVIIDNLDDNGIPLDSKEIPLSEINSIKLPYRWSKVRIFVDVNYTKLDINNSNTNHDGREIASWSPNFVTFNIEDTENASDDYICSNINDLPSVHHRDKPSNPLTIYDETSGLTINNNVVPGYPIKVRFNTTEKTDFFLAYVETVENNYKFLDVKLINSPTFNIDELEIIDWKFLQVDTKSSLRHTTGIKSFSSVISMKEIDLYTLMNETKPDDNNKFSIVQDVDGESFLVVKTPTDVSFPNSIVNKLHFTRNFLKEGVPTTFTTGSQGNTNNHPTPLDDGVDLSSRPRNTDESQEYPENSSYNKTVQIHDPADSGFLFWDTAENIQTYYRIEYAIPLHNRPAGRLFLRAKFISDNLDNTSVLDSYTLIVNSKEDVRRDNAQSLSS